jgi:hypothetical protein
MAFIASVDLDGRLDAAVVAPYSGGSCGIRGND